VERDGKPASTPNTRPSSGSGAFARTSSDSLPAVSSSRSRSQETAVANKTLVQILCSSGSNLLEPTHTYLTAYCSGRFGHRAAERLSLAVYELLANAMAYSSLGDVVVEIIEGAVATGVRVTNNTTNARIGMLNTHVAKLRTDAGKTMLDEMKRSTTGTIRPMLGLARIVHEAGCQLDVSITGQRVVVTAYSRG
jgi:hypothetical protein